MNRLWSLALLLAWACASPSERHEQSAFSFRVTTLIIPQVDYEGALYTIPGNPFTQLDRARVRRDRIVDKQHVAIVMENEYVTLTLLPEMGRVYSLISKATGHEIFWRNDTVTVGGGQNPLGWWLWIGGAEYTLPGDEHGTTWAERWTYEIAANTDDRKAVRMSVTERGTGLEENLEIALYADRSFYEARIEIVNPTSDTVQFAHWINPQWTPGGRNELTDNTEFIIPTERILIPERFQDNLGASPQDWRTSRLRFIKGWDSGWGDLMADGLEHGFYAAYSHDEEEGVVRVFDKDVTPGADIWTYGYHPQPPRGIPMGSGKPNKGYVEMWGGTSKLYPDERRPIGPGETVAWTEWMYPFRGTGSLSYANEHVALHVGVDNGARRLMFAVDATRVFHDVRVLVHAGVDTLLQETIVVTPGDPVRRAIASAASASEVRVRLDWGDETLADVTITLQ